MESSSESNLGSDLVSGLVSGLGSDLRSNLESYLGSNLESGLDQQANSADLQCLWEAVCNLQNGQVLLESLLSGFCEDGMKEYHRNKCIPDLSTWDFCGSNGLDLATPSM